MRNDPFIMHRLALAPFLDSDQPVEIPKLLNEAEKEGTNDFLQFLIFNGLAPLWHEALIKSGQINKINPEFAEKLRQVRLISEANYLNQKNTLIQIHNILTTAGIQYAVFKGAQVRELIYEKPGLRPCADIDILIPRQDRDKAIKTLINAGMRFLPNEEVFSHECTLMDKTTSIDLHWNIMRTGRTRIDLTEVLLKNPVNSNGINYLNNEASLFVLLVHPAFNKYISSKDALLIRLVDLYKFLNLIQFKWDIIIDLINKGSVNTATWSTLYWLSFFNRKALPHRALQIRKPSFCKRKYIEFWVNNNLPTKLYEHRLIMRFGLGIFLHDNIKDGLRAILILISRERKIPIYLK